jgi:hypothetical protein
MSKTKIVRLSEDEIAAFEAFKASTKPAESIKEVSKTTDAQQALADAFVNAIERTRPPQKQTVATLKRKTPWMPADGSPKPKMKRKFYQHGLIIGNNVSSEEIELLNRLKPGRFCEGNVIVTLRKDKGIDIDYPVRTASQRLKLVNVFGIRSFSELLRRCIDEKSDPKKYRAPEDADLYDLE